ncbi:methylmalonyl-CoA mutase [Flavobacteriaceae bacterium R38]|nr:methylmalonyl-CoA mutase [Flavobacteriaceae bacterium R38]
MSEFLFDEFDAVSAKQWKQKIQVDLKGADYNETLIWNTPEGIDIKPFYHNDDESDFINIAMPSKQNICQKIYAGHVSKANEKAIDAIERGAESIFFIIPEEKTAIDQLLSGIDLIQVPIHLEMQFLSASYVKTIKEYITGKQASVHLYIDSIGHLARTGNWYYDLKKDHQILEEIVDHSESFKTTLSVDLSLYQNSGALITQQLAYSIAHANEYLNHFQEADNLPSFTFKVAVGSNYFFEIAKIRALRALWKCLADEYQIESDCHIIAEPSKRNKTLYDYNVNMLRTTTETMSAMLGGANTICNLPYDAIYHKDNEFGERISRNQLLVLKNESYFDKVDNPVDGAYFLENLTHQLAEKALEIFKNIEAGGGFLKQLKEHIIQRKIKESATVEQERFDNGKEVLLGTNKYPNAEDRMKDDLELYPFIKTDSRKTLIEPIIERRLAEKLEQERLETER